MSGKKLPAGLDLERYRTDPSATCLDLSNTKLSNSQFSELTALLDKSRNLTELNLEKCSVRGRLLFFSYDINAAGR